MAGKKLGDLAGRMAKGGAPKGLGAGVGLLGAAALGAYGLSQSVYTGKSKAHALMQLHAWVSSEI